MNNLLTVLLDANDIATTSTTTSSIGLEMFNIDDDFNCWYTPLICEAVVYNCIFHKVVML
jgi:hypothetical protein